MFKCKALKFRPPILQANTTRIAGLLSESAVIAMILVGSFFAGRKPVQLVTTYSINNLLDLKYVIVFGVYFP